MELCDGGDLFQKITDCINKGKLIEEDVIWKIFI
jgi:hypothetical protein